MKLDFLIPASLTDGFCGQIAFFRLCLDALGGSAADARLVAVFGDPRAEELSLRWRRHFDRIGVEWAYSKPGDEDTYQAQHYRRFTLIRPDCDLAVLCDADVVPLRPIDEMVHRLVADAAIGGVIAHLHFPWKARGRIPSIDWPEIAQAVLGHDIERPFRYTLMPHSQPPEAPFYTNYGVFAGPPDVIAEFHIRDLDIREKVFALVGPWWGPQVSSTLTCVGLGLNTVALPMRYNFPNDATADALYPEELRQIVFLHYLRLEHFRRDKIFASPQAFDQFINLVHLTGSNGIFRRHVLRLTGGQYPFAA